MSDGCQLRTIRGDRMILRNRMHSIEEESESSDEELEESNWTRLSSLLTNGLEEEFVQQLSQSCHSDLDSIECEEGDGGDDGREDGGGRGGGGERSGGTLLQRAARAGLARAAAALVRAGADPNASGAGDTEPPLVAAARLGHDAVLQALLHSSGRYPLQVDAADARGDTALHHAARAGRARAVALLLQAGADAGRRNQAGQAALGVAEARALLDFCVSRKEVQGEDYEIELDFSSLAPAIENSDDYFKSSSHVSLLFLESEMLALHSLASTEHLAKELDHPIINIFLEMKLCSMGALAYLNAEFLMVYNFLTIVFSVSAARFSVVRESQMTRKPTSFCSPENYSITFIEEIFRPVCVENFICDPVWLTVLGGILFVIGLVSFIFKICQCGRYFSTYFVLCLWYFNLLFIVLRLTTNHLRLPSHFFGHVPAVVSSFILIDTFFKHPIFSYSIHLFKLVSNKYWLYLSPHCAILVVIIISFYLINIIIHTMSYLNDPPTMHSLSASAILFNTVIIVGEAIDFETIVLAIKIFIVLVALLAIMTANTMMSLATSKIEKIDVKLARRVQYTRILFIMESERLIIAIHNCLVKLQFVPYWIIRLFKSAVLFCPEHREHTCKATWKNSVKILTVKLPYGKQCPLSHELSNRVMKIGEDSYLENSSPDTVTPDMLENELSDLEKNMKARLSNLQNDLQTFITAQNSILQDFIKELDKKIQNSQNCNRDNKEIFPEHCNVWQKQIHVYNSALADNINNSHANLQSGFSRLEKTLGEMMIQLDNALKRNSEEIVPAHSEN